jgi:penicillin-binding protein 2
MKGDRVHRTRIAISIAILIFWLLGIRIIYTTVIFGNSLRSLADDNRFFHKYFSSPRGVVTDRRGVSLVQNGVMYAKVLGDPRTLHPEIKPIDEHEALKLLTSSPEMVQGLQERFYPFGKALAHVMGYVGFASTTDAVFSFNEKVGRDGLERSLNSDLSGQRGIQQYEINAKGTLTRLVRVIDAVPGKDVQVSLDAQLSAGIARIMEGKKGAVVVSNVENSQVLAITSSPAFDPMHLSDSLNDPDKPLINRALQTYPPGSVFKMITALAALKEGKINSDTLIFDEGELKVGESSFRNWYFSVYGRTEGDINVTKALSRSNDVFFYKIAALVGPERIAKMAETFQLGTKTEIELPGERAGLVPSPAWKERVIGEKWYLGDTYHMGIGQGDLLVSPLQVNAMTAALARRGVWCSPTLKLQLPSCKDLGLSKTDLEIVIAGMRDACSEGGTAFPFFSFNAGASEDQKVACKTGTAEFGAKDDRGHRQTHAWFTMFFPISKPVVAITVLLESSGTENFLEGSSDAAPIAKSVWELWSAQKW